MRDLRAAVSAVALAALVAGGCATGTSGVLGRSVTLVPREGGAPKVKGELLAVDQGRVWVRTKDGVREFAPDALQEVRVRRHNLTGGWAVRWGLVGGLVSGVAMAAACSSVEGNDSGGCAGTGAVWGACGRWPVSWPLPVSRRRRRSPWTAERPPEAVRAPARRPAERRRPPVAGPGTARAEIGGRGTPIVEAPGARSHP